MKRSESRLSPFVLAAALAILPLAACAPSEEPEGDDLTTGTDMAVGTETDPFATEPAAGETAMAMLEGPNGEMMGHVSFVREAGGLRVIADLEGLDGSGPHGFHVHETGSCEPPGFESAGGHFNPAGAPHACPPTTPRHAGDLGNVEIGEDGTGHLELTTDQLTLEGEDSVVGKAVLVHGHVDDCSSQPSGDAGPRLACGVVEMGDMGGMDMGTAMDAGTELDGAAAGEVE